MNSSKWRDKNKLMQTKHDDNVWGRGGFATPKVNYDGTGNVATTGWKV